MKILLAAMIVLSLPAMVAAQTEEDAAAIRRTLDSWNEGWATKNARLAVQDYAEDIDWTNAFGDRFQGRDKLLQGLEFIFSLDFVMAGSSGENEFEDVTFLTPDIALLRSKLVRTGQKTASGEAMPDRQIHHLRVLERRDGKWRIISHLISQSHPKGLDPKQREEK